MDLNHNNPSLLYLLKQLHFRLFIVVTVLLFPDRYFARGNDQIDRLNHQLETASGNCEKAIYYNKLARTYISVDLGKAEKQARIGINISKQSGCKKRLGDLYNTLAVIKIYLGKNPDAFAYVDSAISIYKALHFKEGLADAIGNKAIFYDHTGKYDLSLKLQYQCLNLYKELGDKSGEATTLNNMYLIFHFQKDFKRANAVISKSYTLFDELGELDGIAMTTYNKALLYSELSNPDSCMYYARRCVTFYKQLGNPDDIANGYTIYSIALEQNKNYREAIAYADSAITILKHVGQERRILEIYQDKTKCYFELKEYVKSIEVGLQLLEGGRRLGLKQFEHDGANWLMQNYEAIGDYKKAMYYTKLYHRLNDEIMNERSMDKINRLKSEFDFDRKEHELKNARHRTKILGMEVDRKNEHLVALFLILILGLLILWFIFNQRRLASQKRTVQLEHKALRAQMNPHFIFNSLNSIQRMYVEGNLDEANEFTGDFAQLMRRILDNSNKNLVTLKEEIELLTLYLSLENLRCKNMFDYTFDIAGDIDTHSALIPPLVIQPFIENAIWHGILPKKEHGHIHIEMRRENKFIRCVITDNGIGLQDKTIHSRESHGIHITEQRIGNKVHIQNLPEGGVQVEFQILYQTK